MDYATFLKSSHCDSLRRAIRDDNVTAFRTIFFDIAFETGEDKAKALSFCAGYCLSPPLPSKAVFHFLLTQTYLDVKKTINENDETLLHLAALHEDSWAAEILLGNGANINAQTQKEGFTPLHVALELEAQFMPSCAEFLLKKGANAFLETKDGYTAKELMGLYSLNYLEQFILPLNQRKENPVSLDDMAWDRQMIQKLHERAKHVNPSFKKRNP